MQVPAMKDSTLMASLLEGLRATRRQLQQKAGKERQVALMHTSLQLRDTMEGATALVDEPKLCGTLRYSLSQQWVREEADAWLMVGLWV